MTNINKTLTHTQDLVDSLEVQISEAKKLAATYPRPSELKLAEARSAQLARKVEELEEQVKEVWDNCVGQLCGFACADSPGVTA